MGTLPTKMAGIFIQANITSQIISAAMDNRPLLRTYNQLLESLEKYKKKINE